MTPTEGVETGSGKGAANHPSGRKGIVAASHKPLEAVLEEIKLENREYNYDERLDIELSKALTELRKVIREIESKNNDFITEWRHFCDTVNFGQSALDARAIQFMNSVENRIKKPLALLKKETKP